MERIEDGYNTRRFDHDVHRNFTIRYFQTLSRGGEINVRSNNTRKQRSIQKAEQDPLRRISQAGQKSDLERVPDEGA